MVFVVAGIADGAHVPLPEGDRATALKVYETNAVSPIRFAEAFAGRVAPGGLMVLMSSILGSVSLNEGGTWESYRASKAALNTLARSFSARHGDAPFGTVLMHPGWVRTDMGGPEADIDVATSADGMVTVVEGRLGQRAARTWIIGGRRFLGDGPWYDPARIGTDQSRMSLKQTVHCTIMVYDGACQRSGSRPTTSTASKPGEEHPLPCSGIGCSNRCRDWFRRNRHDRHHPDHKETTLRQVGDIALQLSRVARRLSRSIRSWYAIYQI